MIRAVVSAAILCALVATALLMSGTAASSPNTKYYKAAVSPTTASGGSSTSFTVTITDCDKASCGANSVSTQSLGSANVTFPASFTVGAVTAVTPPAGKVWTASVSGHTVQLRNPGSSNTYALAPGQSVSVTVSATPPASCGGPFSLTTQSKQSNDFSGTGNDFTRVGPEPSITVGPGTLDHFTWTTQPAASQRAGTSFGATVTAYDSCGNVKTNYNGSTATLSGLGTSPNSTAPSYSLSWSNGVGTGTFTDFRAETGVQLTITDGAVAASSSSFDVAPGPLDSFAWTTQPGPNQTAGASFGATVTAYDHWGNQKTDYSPPAAPFSGLGTSPNNTAPSYSASWSNGVGTGTFTDFRAETGVQLTITDGAVAASSSSFDVAPGSLGSFTWTTQPGAAQNVGVAFGGAVTAADSWGNVIGGYTGGSFSLSGLGTSPHNDAPVYGSVSWASGVGTISGVTDFKAETANLVANDGAVHSSSQSITVAPGPLSSLAWTQQPTETAKQAAITPSPTVTATDQYGNPISGAAITASLTTLSGTGTFTQNSTLTANTNAAGVATFGNLAITDTGQYQLVGTSSNNVTATSIAFVIANQVNPCNGSCNATGSVKNNTQTDASATNAPSGASLAVSVIGNDVLGGAPAGACGVGGNFNFAQLGAGSWVNVVSTSGGTPTPNFTITWTLDKSIVQTVPDNGASHFDICLGAENLLDPQGLNTVPWTTKFGAPSIRVVDVNGIAYYWGLLPDCPAAGPCVQSRHKDKAGDEVVTFLKPSPWDGHYFGGGP